MKYLILTFILFGSTASAQDWFDRAGDRLLSEEELTAEIAGRTLLFYDDGQAYFGADERYSYTYLGGASSDGQYKIFPSSLICIEFDNGFDRCDRLIENDGRLVLLTEDHLRFPVREILDGPPVLIAEP